MSKKPKTDRPYETQLGAKLMDILRDTEAADRRSGDRNVLERDWKIAVNHAAYERNKLIEQELEPLFSRLDEIIYLLRGILKHLESQEE